MWSLSLGTHIFQECKAQNDSVLADQETETNDHANRKALRWKLYPKEMLPPLTDLVKALWSSWFCRERKRLLEKEKKNLDKDFLIKIKIKKDKDIKIKLDKDLTTAGIGRIYRPSYSMPVAMVVTSHSQANEDISHVFTAWDMRRLESFKPSTWTSRWRWQI